MSCLQAVRSITAAELIVKVSVAYYVCNCEFHMNVPVFAGIREIPPFDCFAGFAEIAKRLESNTQSVVQVLYIVEQFGFLHNFG